mmetsp:Transcript_8400/g.20792  ORF Transcript_8400/g.20792 Transcript_8400/m.20792 type:complete len:201 (-) Transcript_8400:33-635(-)
MPASRISSIISSARFQLPERSHARSACLYALSSGGMWCCCAKSKTWRTRLACWWTSGMLAIERMMTLIERTVSWRGLVGRDASALIFSHKRSTISLCFALAHARIALSNECVSGCTPARSHRSSSASASCHRSFLSHARIASSICTAEGVTPASSSSLSTAAATSHTPRAAHACSTTLDTATSTAAPLRRHLLLRVITRP